MIPNGKEMNWEGHRLRFESEHDICRGCFFCEKDSCPDCDEGAWIEDSPWCTGTPTEEGWYLIAFTYEFEEGVRYTTDYFKDGKWAFPMVRDISKLRAWQKIEPYKEENNG